MAEGLTVGANDGYIISVAFIESVELKVLALTCSTLSSCMSICLLLSLAVVPSELTCVAKAKKRAREVANNFAAVKKDMRFMVVLLYG